MLVQYNADGSYKSGGYYHVSCFRERHLLNNKTNDMLSRTMKILEKAEMRMA